MRFALRWIAAALLAAPLLALAAVSPAHAQQSVGLDWMIGKWCMDNGTCLDIHKRADGAVITDWKASDGRTSQGVITMEEGRAVLTTQNIRAAEELSRGPNEIVLKHTGGKARTSSELDHLRYSRDGDSLTLEFTFGDGETQAAVYRRAQ